jgi:oligopeptide transport system substrate-binding protein
MRFSPSIVPSLAIASALMTPGCTTDSRYFGRTIPPTEQRLVFENASEPETLDPAKTTYSGEVTILPALFEGLVQYHPETLEPMAALATHYETNADRTRFTFYQRGHLRPQGIKLPNTGTLRDEYLAGKVEEDFARGKSAPTDNIPARWSDGTIITAHDFVYSWRRAADPETASPFAFYLFPIRNAEQINAGRLRPESLAVRALDDFTFQVELRAPAPFFLKLLCTSVFAAVPRQAIELARQRGLESSWTHPGNMVTSGSFRLREWRPYDRLVIQKSPTYYEADLVQLRKIVFLSVADGMTNVNLYKAGDADMMDSAILPPVLLSRLRQTDDLRIDLPLNCRFYSMNINRPPFDNALLRYALNMAVDKKPIAEFLGVGRFVAFTLVTPMAGYQAPGRLNVPVDGQIYDVLSYSPAAARALLAKAGFPDGFGRDGRRLTFELRFPMRPRSLGSGEILQRQWRENLNIDVKLAALESKVWLRTLTDRDYNGMVEDASLADYLDPNAFLEMFVTGSGSNASGWSDPGFDALLAAANSTIEPATRARKLQECELFLLRAMPIVPLYFEAQSYLRKPYVRGVGPYRVWSRLFKYAWIDSNWKLEAERKQVSRN